MATPVEITYRVVGADQVAGALQQMENRARQMSSTMTGTMAPARQAVSALSSALSSTATILRMTGNEGQALAGHLETATLAISATAVAVQTLRGATLALTGVMVAARAVVATLAVGLAAVAAAAAPIAAAIAIIVGVLAIGTVMVKEFAGATRGLAETSIRVDAGMAGLRVRMEEYKLSADDLAAGMRMGQLAAKDLREELARKAKQLGATAEAQKKLADAIRETRIQGELNLIVSTVTAERARDIENALRRQTQTLRDWADAVAQQLNPAMQAAIDLFLSFKTPAEEGVIRPTNQITENLEEVANAALAAARILGVDWTEALTVARQALQLAKEEGIGLADALARIKFNRDFLIELELVDSGMKKWFDAWEKIKFGMEDFNIQGAIDPALAALDQLAARAQEMKQAIGQAFSGLFSDILSGARTFGDALSNFFRAIANVILQHFLLKIILPFLGLQRGGIVAGGLVPLLAAQGGGIVSRPTLALMGEGRQSEAVVPLPDNRSIPVKFIGQTASPREAVIHLTIHNVIGDPRALGIMTAGDVAGVIVNDVSRRGPTIQAIRVALGP